MEVNDMKALIFILFFNVFSFLSQAFDSVGDKERKIFKAKDEEYQQVTKEEERVERETSSFNNCTKKHGQLIVCPEGTYTFESGRVGNMINDSNKMVKPYIEKSEKIAPDNSSPK
jgi:hypothetical protein